MFNRETILKRREVAQGVADRLFAAEQAIDAAIAKTAELTGYIPGARVEAGLACEVAQEALEYAAESFSALIRARAQIIASHRELNTTKDQIGLRTVSFGGAGAKPFNSEVRHLTEVAAA
jgi:hypothetical protein